MNKKIRFLYIIKSLENKKVFYGSWDQKLVDRLQHAAIAAPNALPPHKAISANASKG